MIFCVTPHKVKKIIVIGFFLSSSVSLFGQEAHTQKTFLKNLVIDSIVPDGLLAKRSIVLYSPPYHYAELQKIQRMFQRTGIDAVGYFKFDMVFANAETTQKAYQYFKKREISFLIFIYKQDTFFSVLFTRFNGHPTLVDSSQPAWGIRNTNIDQALKNINRSSIYTQPKKNLLINDFPENNFTFTIVEGKRFNFFAIDLEVDRLAVPWFNNPSSDSTLLHIFRENYPFSFDMVNADEDVLTLRNKGFLYIMKYTHASKITTKTLLGYSPDKQKISDRAVYKFYIQHLVSNNIFLGTQWDANISWEESLETYINRFKKELGH